MGYTPEFTVGVWVGQFNNAPLKNITGSSGAGPVFHQIMERLHRDIPPTWYDRPESLVEAEIDVINGKRISPDNESWVRDSRLEIFRPDFVPPFAYRSDYSVDGRTLIPGLYGSWFSEGSHLLIGKAAVRSRDPMTKGQRQFRITSPMAGTVAFLDPDLPGGGTRFPLRISSAEINEVEWTSSTLQIESGDGPRVWAILEPGEHEITAVDQKTGIESTTRFRVEAL